MGGGSGGCAANCCPAAAGGTPASGGAGPPGGGGGRYGCCGGAAGCRSGAAGCRSGWGLNPPEGLGGPGPGTAGRGAPNSACTLLGNALTEGCGICAALGLASCINTHHLSNN